MNVWIENPFDNLPSEGCRPQRYWLMARAFADAGHTVTYFTADFSHARKRKRDFAGHKPDAPFRLLLMPTRPYRRNVSWMRLLSHRAYAKTFRAFAADECARGNAPDLLIASMPPLSTCAVAREIKRTTGCRLVFDIQDAWPETFLRLFPTPLKRLGRVILAPLARSAAAAYRGADRLTGVTERYRPLVTACGASDYRVFPLGVELPPEASFARRDRPFALVYVGSLGRGYDLGTVIRAVLKLPDATLDIAGAGEREDEWRAAAHGDPRIRFHGYLDSHALSALLARCAVGVIPMRDDSFVGVPNKLADYAAHGLLTVSSLGGVCADLLKAHGLGAHYDWGSESSLLAALRLTRDLKPDFAPLLDRLDAAKVYPAYVRHVVIDKR